MRWRYRFVLLFYIFCFFATILRLAHWQIVEADTLSSIGESQYGRSITLSPRRGEIKTSDDFPVASNKLTYLVYANPKQINDIATTAQILSPLLEQDVASISSLLSMNRFWVAISPGVDYYKKQQVQRLNLPGVGFEEQYIRYYPEASVAAQLLGFVGKNDLGKSEGYFGLEGYYDRQLRGKEAKAVQIHDALGRPILARVQASPGGDDGRNLILHIDRVVQFLVEEELKQSIERYGAQGGTVIVMNPKTGGILAMSSQPSFDPHRYWGYEESVFKNPIVSSTYEPGSTFKPLIVSSALDAGVVTPLTKCTICDGPVPIGGYEIRTWNNKYHSGETVMETIQFSDNIGMVFVAQKLGLKRLLSYLEKFGIGETTGIDLQGETPAILRGPDSWYPIDLATASFGQGISITPLQLLSAFSTIANDGVRMEPHVVDKIETENGKVIPIPPQELSKPISAATARVMTEILVNAVDKGEAKWAKPKGYRIAGKTGTAQIPIGGHYDPNKTIASFIGFAPADEPQFVMLVIIDRPTSSIFGSETAAPTFFTIAKKILLHLNIAPTE
ncbi:MAG: penicillin-binding protein 2 [Candidatus Levybacteria bacterium]|nr:penicillin-binding protein 2 [Candidatus Levybacteria bacterium]